MNTSRVNSISKSSIFELIYPPNLNGLIQQSEFEILIKRINKQSTLSAKYNIILLFLILVGIILIVIGVVKGFSKEVNQILAAFGLIISLFSLFLLSIIFIISKINISDKIKYELDLINENYKSKNIKWSLRHDLTRNFINEELYKKKLGKSSFMYGIKYDKNNKPYREEYIYFIEIESPSRFLQNLTVKTISSNQNHCDTIISIKDNNNNNNNNKNIEDEKGICVNMDELKNF
ncbi:hypothetical protein ACTFIZ_007878 [Dictyostelium cf. discoideum]